MGTGLRRITLSPRPAPDDVAAPRSGVAATLMAQLSLAPCSGEIFCIDKNPEKADAGAAHHAVIHGP